MVLSAGHPPRMLLLIAAAAASLTLFLSPLRADAAWPCSPDIVSSRCVGSIVPFSDYSDAFPIIEYCLHPVRGFIAATKDACLGDGIGNWTVRPDWAAVNATLEEQYNCAVCQSLNESALSPNSASVWLLNVANKTIIKGTDFTTWGKVLKSKVDQVVVSHGGKRYLYVLGTYNSVQTLKTKYPKTFLLTQPVPSELKISPRLYDPNLDAANNGTMEIKVKTLMSSRTGTTKAAMDLEHEDGLGLVRSITNNPQSAWCMETNCTVSSVGKGTYAISHVDPLLTFDLALNVSTSLATVYVVDIKFQFKTLNYGASVVSQSGTNASLGGTTTLWTHGGLSGSGVVVGVGDTGMDHQSCFFYDPNYPVTFTAQYSSDLLGYYKVFSSTGHRKIREYFAYVDSKEGVDGGHGTHVCGTLGGYPAQMSATSSAYKYQGMAYKAKLAFFDIGSSSSGYLYVPSDLTTGYFPRTYNLGGRLHSNSWGSDYNANSDEMYQSDTYLYNNQDFLVIYAAGNAGNGSYTVGNPAVAKNPLAVGSTDNYMGHPDVSDFSARGPTYDYRFKPDICATGDPLWSAYSMAASTSNQCYVISMSGTSMATPTVAGNAALLVEYFNKGYYPLGYANSDHSFTPMGSLVKAMLINSGRQMTGTEATRHNTASVTFPNWDQGFGYIAGKYSAYLQGEGVSPNMLFADGEWSTACASCPTFTASGQTKKYYFTPTKSTSLRITLVWHDYPVAATVSTKALINDLDLTARQGSTSYYANGQSSTAGYNALNNVEQITIKTPTVGSTVTVTVTAYSLTTTQPYSIVVTGAFRKDYRNFNAAIPHVDVIATDGAQALFVGKNLPASSGFNYTINMTCVSDPHVKVSATVLQYSTAATYLAATLSTTACRVYKVNVISDNFIGNRSASLVYGSVNISTYCDTIAYDQTCWSLGACTGKCKLVDSGKAKGGMDLMTIITLIVVLVAVVLGACAGGYGIYYCCCKKKKGQHAAAAAANRNNPQRGGQRAVVVNQQYSPRGPPIQVSPAGSSRSPARSPGNSSSRSPHMPSQSPPPYGYQGTYQQPNGQLYSPATTARAQFVDYPIDASISSSSARLTPTRKHLA